MLLVGACSKGRRYRATILKQLAGEPPVSSTVTEGLILGCCLRKLPFSRALKSPLSTTALLPLPQSRIRADQRQLIAAPHERGFNSAVTQPPRICPESNKVKCKHTAVSVRDDPLSGRMGLRLSLVSSSSLSSSSHRLLLSPVSCDTRVWGCSCVNRD